jgi:uncharacterized protein (TIGR03067 family)
MRKRMLAVLAVGLLLGASPVDDTKDDLAKMEGEWTLVSMERDGEQPPEEFIKSLRRVVKGDEYTVTGRGQDGNPATLSKGKFKLDASKKPKTIDFTPSGGVAAGETLLGIYELQGDTLKVCYAMPSHDRPKEYKTPEGSHCTLSVWKRVKK